MRRRSRSDQGSVFILAVMVMTAMIVFGVVYAESATLSSQISESELARLQARALADGAIEVGYQKLVDAPFFRGTVASANLGGGSYTVSLASVGSDVEITGQGSVKGVNVDWRALARVEATDAFTDAMRVRSDVWISNSASVTWAGNLRYRGGWFVTATADGRSLLDPSIQAFSIDLGHFQSKAAQVYASDTELPGGAHNGVIYVNGMLSVREAVQVTGTLVTNGDLVIDSQSNPVVIDQGTEAAALVVQGNLQISNSHDLTITGPIFVTGEVRVTDSTNVSITGSLLVNQDLHFNGSTVLWNLDPTLSNPIVAGVSNLPPATYRVEVEEQWRRPN